MEHRGKGMPDSSRTLASIVTGEDSRQPIHRMPDGLTIRVREIDCMLADIQAHMQILRREKTHLGLVREELAGGMEAKRRGSSPCKTLLK
jgi:hypothetical protein